MFKELFNRGTFFTNDQKSVRESRSPISLSLLERKIESKEDVIWNLCTLNNY